MMRCMKEGTSEERGRLFAIEAGAGKVHAAEWEGLDAPPGPSFTAQGVLECSCGQSSFCPQHQAVTTISSFIPEIGGEERRGEKKNLGCTQQQQHTARCAVRTRTRLTALSQSEVHPCSFPLNAALISVAQHLEGSLNKYFQLCSLQVMSALLLPAITASSSSGSGSSRRAGGRGGPFREIPGTISSPTEQHRALLVGKTNVRVLKLMVNCGNL